MMTGKKGSRNENMNDIKCCIVFPVAYTSFFEIIVSDFLNREFDLEYKFFAYENTNKEIVDFIKNTCESPCILVIAFAGRLSLEHFYKLGIAHALNTCVILIELRKEDGYSLPDYINYKFVIHAVPFSKKEDIENLLQKIRDVIAASLFVNTVEVLYQEALSIITTMEGIKYINIAKVDKETFIQRLSDQDISLCLNSRRASRKILLERIILDEFSLAHVYLVVGDFLSKIEEVNPMGNRDKYTLIGEYISGDKILGDKVMGNKDTIAGNKIQTGNVAGDAITGNKIVNSQNLTQAAQEIKELLDRISATDQTNNSTLIAIQAIEAIEKNPTLKDRIINAVKEAGFAAIDAAVDHPAIKIVTAAIKGAIEA
jgi:hypothetical protein